MTEPVRISDLRADIVDRQTLHNDDNPLIDLAVSEVLGLIDIAEAARDYREAILLFGDQAGGQELDNALARFTFEARA